MQATTGASLFDSLDEVTNMKGNLQAERKPDSFSDYAVDALGQGGAKKKAPSFCGRPSTSSLSLVRYFVMEAAAPKPAPKPRSVGAATTTTTTNGGNKSSKRKTTGGEDSSTMSYCK